MKELRILIVDDDEVSIQLMQKIISDAGHQVTTSPNAKEALNQLAADTYEIVFTDLVMKDMNGDELCVEIKKMWPDVEVVLVSAFPAAISRKIDNFMDAGGSEVLHKPVSPFELNEVIEKIVTRKELE